jgi:hypothetical protein
VTSKGVMCRCSLSGFGWSLKPLTIYFDSVDGPMTGSVLLGNGRLWLLERSVLEGHTGCQVESSPYFDMTNQYRLASN